METESILAISRIVVIVCVAAILVWDLVAVIISRGKLKASVSWAIWEFCRKAPFVPFLVGFVCGHLFWGDPRSGLDWGDMCPPCPGK